MDKLLATLQPLNMADHGNKNNAKTHLKKLTPFYGDRKLVKKFLQECDLYILGNSKDFPDDTSRVIFILSYIDDREAEKWKQYYIDNEVITAGSYVWPKIAEFYAQVKEAFAFKDKREDSVRKLETLRQGNRNAKEMTSEFWLLVAKAGLNEDNQMLICTYRCALNPQLANKIMYSTDKPSTLKDTGKDATLKKGWYSIAAQYNQIHHKAQEAMKEQQLIGSLPYAQKNTNNNWWPWYNYSPQQQHDPNAMDVNAITMVLNAMSYKEWGKYLHDRLCFYCKQPGYISCKCPKKQPMNVGNFGAGCPHNNQGSFAQSNNAFNRKPDAPKRLGPQELNKYIRVLTNEEHELIFDMVKANDNDKGPIEKDFWSGGLQGVLQSLPHLVLIMLFLVN